jgi:fibronectin-binding autotransporter adhesin
VEPGGTLNDRGGVSVDLGGLDDKGILTVAAGASLFTGSGTANSVESGTNFDVHGSVVVLGTLTDPGVVTVEADGTLSDQGVVTVEAGGTLTDRGVVTVEADRTLTDLGTVVVADTGTLTLSGGTVTGSANGSLIVNGALNESAGDIGGALNLAVSGTFTWTGGSMDGTGTTMVAAQGHLNVPPGRPGPTPPPLVNRALTVLGQATITTSALEMGSSAVSDFAAPTVIHGCQLTLDAGAQCAFDDTAIVGASTIEENSDSTHTSTLTNTRNLMIVDSTHLMVHGGSVFHSTSTSHTSVQDNGDVEVDFNSLLSVGVGATLTIAADGILDDQGTVTVADTGTLTLSGGTLTGSSSGSLTVNGALNERAGDIGGALNLTVSGTFTWTGGSMDGTGTTMVTAQGQFTVSAGAPNPPPLLNRALNDLGQAAIDSDLEVGTSGNGNFNGTTAIENATLLMDPQSQATLAGSTNIRNSTINEAAGAALNALTSGTIQDSTINAAAQAATKFGAGSAYDLLGNNLFGGAGQLIDNGGMLHLPTGANSIFQLNTILQNAHLVADPSSLCTLAQNTSLQDSVINADTDSILNLQDTGSSQNCQYTAARGAMFKFRGAGMNWTLGVNNNFSGDGHAYQDTGTLLAIGNTTFTNLDAVGGVLSVSALVNINGQLGWGNGTLSGPGTTAVGPNGTVVGLPGMHQGLTQGTLDVSGSLQGTYNLLFGNHGIFKVEANAQATPAGLTATGQGEVDNYGNWLYGVGNWAYSAQAQYNNLDTGRTTLDAQGTLSLGGGGQTTGAFLINGQFDAQNLNSSGGGQITVSVGGGAQITDGDLRATFEVEGTARLNGVRTQHVTGSGLIEITSPNPGPPPPDGPCTFDGTYDVTGTTEVLSGGSVIFLTRAHTASFVQDGGSVQFASGGGLAIDTEYDVGAGNTLNLAGGTLTVPQLVLLQGGTVNGPGTINGNVSNAGQFNPGVTGAAGLLSINGNYTQTETGVLNIQIGGTNPGADYDQLSITGMATLGGTLNVSLINGFVPTSGATFQILTFGSWDGSTFTTLNLDPLFQNPVTYDPLDVTIVAN